MCSLRKLESVSVCYTESKYLSFRMIDSDAVSDDITTENIMPLLLVFGF